MAPNTRLQNEYVKYFIIRERDWHEKKIGYYHVSVVGCNHQYLEPDKHSGPCLRAAFYEYTSPKEQSLSTKGNFHVGNSVHSEVELKAKINDPFCFPEFPLQRLFEHKGHKIIALGSIDIPTQKELTLEDNAEDPILISVIDLKTASNWTFPFDESDINPTHFDQTKIYSFWLITYYLNRKYNKMDELTITYINKHEYYCGEQTQKYNNLEAKEIFTSFIKRCFKLDSRLKKFVKLKHNYDILFEDEPKPNEDRVLELKLSINKCLPDAEPMHWCKFCDNRNRCRDNVYFDEDVRMYSIAEIEKLYENETGKKSYYRGKHTQAYNKFEYGFKVEAEDDL